MNLLITIGILISAETFAVKWDSYFESIEFSGLPVWMADFLSLLVQMPTFLFVDILTIFLLSLFPVQILTKYLQAILCLSVVSHAFGIVSWISSNDSAVFLYDDLKDLVFYLELVGFILYGIYRSGKRLGILAPRRGVDMLHSMQGHYSGIQVSKRAVGRDS